MALETRSVPVLSDLAVYLIAPEHVPDERHHRQYGAGNDDQGHGPLSVTSNGGHAGAGSAGVRVRSCAAPAGEAGPGRPASPRPDKET